ncbi:MAG: ATP synthase subunit I [Acidobacteriota bacterium]
MESDALRRFARRSLLITAVLTGVAGLVMWWISGFWAFAATIAGSAIVMMNTVLIVRGVGKLTDRPGRKGYGAFLGRFMLLGLCFFAIIPLLKLSPVGVVVGVTMIIPGVTMGLVLEWKE